LFFLHPVKIIRIVPPPARGEEFKRRSAGRESLMKR
jgi:hypothetical protein